MRKLIVSLIALSLLILPLSAQSIRTASLGVGGIDVDDIGNIQVFPQLSGLYQNKVWFYSIDDSDDVWQTTVLAELMGHTAGIQLTDVSSSATGVNPGTIGADNLYINDLTGNGIPIPVPETVINALLATELGGGTAGLNLMWATGSETYEEDTNNTSAAVTYTDDMSYEGSASYIGVQLGFSMEEVGPMSRLDTSVGIGLPGIDMTYDNPVDSTDLLANPSALGEEETIEKDGGMDLSVAVQGVMSRDDGDLRVQVGFSSSAIEYTANEKNDADMDGLLDDVTDTHDQYTELQSVNNLSVRVVRNKQVNDGGLVILGAGLGRFAESYEYTEKYLDDPNSDGTYTLETQDTYTDEWSVLYIPVVLAVEDKINDNVTLRIGAQKNVLILESDESVDDGYGIVGGVANSHGKNNIYTTTTSDRGAGDVNLAMGVGAEFNNFVINVETEADILVGGPYWITGDASTFGVAAEAIYSF